MTILSRFLTCLAAAAFALLAAGAPAPAQAASTGLLILEGSDSQTYHGLDPYSTNFLNGLATFSTAPTLPVAIFGYNPIGTPGVGKAFLSGVLPTLSTMLSLYSGIYLNASSSCCSETSLSFTDATTIASFLAAGRSVAIEDYQGGAQFDPIVGTSGGANSHVAGHGGGASSSLGDCFDNNTVAAGGASYGLGAIGAAVPNLSCFGHQAYEAAFFDTLGLTTYIVTAPSPPGFNVVISNGGGGLAEAVITAAPEPMSMALFGVGLAGLAAARRGRRG